MSAAIKDIDGALYREVMGHFATGITVITTRVDGQEHGMTANAFMAGSLHPPLCLVSIRHEARMHGLLERSARFGVSVLGQEQQYLSNHFAGRPVPGLQPEFDMLVGVPVIGRAIAQIAAQVVERVECGDHTLFIGHIDEMQCTPKAPLLFYAGRYARIDRDQPIEEFVPHTFW